MSLFTIINGMAVLIIRFSLVIIAYQLLSKLNWHKLLTDKNYHFAQPLCLFLSLGLGHLAGSFLITIIEVFYDTIRSLLLI